MSKFGSAGIQFVGKTIGSVGRKYVVRQVAPAIVRDGLFSDQVEMISGHVLKTQCAASCSRLSPIATRVFGVVVDAIESTNIMV
jgi:hypothetical protein